MDAFMFPEKSKAPEPQDTETLSMFDEPTVNVPDIRTPPPSAPGSTTSEAAAECVSDPMRRKSLRAILYNLATARGPVSMQQISMYADIPINVVCARIPDLEPIWIQRHEGACRSLVKPSLAVDGFTLTDAGRKRVAEAA